MDGFVLALIGVVLGQTALIWRKLGIVETAVKTACPFGKCPMWSRAKDEAAPHREAIQNSD
jgi:hypothetical protein